MCNLFKNTLHNIKNLHSERIKEKKTPKFYHSKTTNCYSHFDIFISSLFPISFFLFCSLLSFLFFFRGGV